MGILPEIDAAVAVRPGDPVALATAVERMILEPDFRLASARATAEWISGYSLEWTVKNALAFYDSLTSDRPIPATIS